jgi:hypothetical protein
MASKAQDDQRAIDLLKVQYTPVNFSSLSNLSFKLGDYDLSNDQLVDEYIAITNCSLYSKYYTDDFLWQRIRNGVRRQLNYYASQFTDRYETVSAIDLGRYDFQKAAFILPENSKLENVAYFRLAAIQQFNGMCSKDIDILPVAYTSILNTPINLKEVPMNADTARLVIKKSLVSENPDRRMAVIRIRMKLLGIEKPSKNGQSLFKETKFRTEIDDITIFASSRMDKILWQQSFKDFNR